MFDQKKEGERSPDQHIPQHGTPHMHLNPPRTGIRVGPSPRPNEGLYRQAANR